MLCAFNLHAEDYWHSLNGPAGQVNCLVFDTTSSVIYAGTSGDGIFRSADNSGIWTQINSGITNLNIKTLAVNSAGNIFAGTFGGGVFISTNAGESWSSVNTGLSNQFIYSLAVAPDGNIFAGTGLKVFLSVNNGNFWTPVFNGLPQTSISSVSVSSAGVIFVTSLGLGLYRSTDNGGLWVLHDSGITNPDIKSSIAVSNTSVFAGTFNGIYRSTNNGDNWIRKDSGITNLAAVYSFVKNSYGFIFAGKYGGGVYMSADNGEYWNAVNTGLTFLNVTSLAAGNNGEIFAGTTGGGVYKSNGTITSIEQNVTDPMEYDLRQNYPNPFNPETNIEYSIRNPGFVSLKIYDVLGQEVEEAVSERKATGNYSIRFNGSGLSGGIYFYELIIDGTVASVRRMVLLK